MLLNPQAAHQLPISVLEWLELAHGNDPRGTLDELLSEVAREQAQLWGAFIRGEWKAVAITRIFPMDSCSVFRVQLCGGEELGSWKHLLSKLEDVARDLGCQLIEILGRRGWQRIYPEYRMRAVLLEKEV